jgi:hypothetical protein
MKINVGNGTGAFTLLAITLLILKLCKVITISYFWIVFIWLIPLWIVLGIVGGILVGIGVLRVVIGVLRKWE